MLGFIPDVRNHPAVNYYRSGIPIVIAGDDPGSFGYNDLTVDYYLAFMAWGLTLYDLREIANNSIRYSSLPDRTRTIGFAEFKRQWDTFIENTHKEICGKSLYDYGFRVKTTNIYPGYGPNLYPSKLTIYGYGFEHLLCKRLKCVFDHELETGAELTRLNEIECKTPLGFSHNQLVNVSIKSDELVIDTGLKYRFLFPTTIKVKEDEISTELMEMLQELSSTQIVLLVAVIFFDIMLFLFVFRR